VEYPEEVFADTANPIIARIHNRRKFAPTFLVRISCGDQEPLFPLIGSGASVNHCFMFFPPRRGRHRVGDIRISSVFPFNLFTRYKTLAASAEVVVFPKPQKCQLTHLSNRQIRSRGETSSNLAGFDSDLISIRNYVAGDPPKYISWKSTAKTGQLKTKELSSIELQNVIIDFDRMDKGNLEYAISCVTFTVLKLLRSRTPVGLAIDGEMIGPDISGAHKVKILTKLALYGQT